MRYAKTPNMGYEAIPQYDSSAGGRTAAIEMTFDERITINLANLGTLDPDDTFPAVLLNVDSPIWVQGIAHSTLQTWILDNILSQ